MTHEQPNDVRLNWIASKLEQFAADGQLEWEYDDRGGPQPNSGRKPIGDRAATVTLSVYATKSTRRAVNALRHLATSRNADVCELARDAITRYAEDCCEDPRLFSPPTRRLGRGAADRKERRDSDLRIRVTTTTRDLLRSLAKQNFVTVAEVIRQAIVDYVTPTE